MQRLSTNGRGCRSRKFYVLQTKKLDETFQSTGKKCAKSIADRNCGWDSIVKAADMDRTSYGKLWSETTAFGNKHLEQITAVFRPTINGSQKDWQTKLLKNLSTDWACINEMQLTVVTWKLQRDIKIFYVYTLHCVESAYNNF